MVQEVAGSSPVFHPKMKNVILISALCALFSCTQNKDSSTSTVGDTTLITETITLDVLDTVGGKGVFFVDLKDSQEVKNPVLVKMGVKGMEIENAGAISELKGHHHIIVDGESTPEGQPVLLDETHLHFGKGQTETELKLTPGYHTITLQFGNGVHSSYGPRWSKTITINVKK